ncbi:unnamed protein product [Discula destructiva]
MAPKKTTTAGPVASSTIESWPEAKRVWDGYWTKTSHQTLVIDGFLAFLLAVGGIQALYFVVCGRNPYNAFLAGFLATVGQFVLTIALRMQTQEQNKTQFPKVTPERSFAEYVFGSLILQLFCVNYLN